MRALTLTEVDIVAGGTGTVTVTAPRPAAGGGGGFARPLTHIYKDWCGSGLFDVPDSPGGFDFSQSCKLHDMLYAGLRDQGAAGKAAADATFLESMLKWCEEHAPGDEACKRYAYLYFAGVVAGGGFAFNFGGN